MILVALALTACGDAEEAAAPTTTTADPVTTTTGPVSVGNELRALYRFGQNERDLLGDCVLVEIVADSSLPLPDQVTELSGSEFVVITPELVSLVLQDPGERIDALAEACGGLFP